MDFPGGSDDKESACNAGVPGSIPGLGRFPWRRAQQPNLVFLPGESHGQRSLAGYSLCSRKELDTTEWLTHILNDNHSSKGRFQESFHQEFIPGHPVESGKFMTQLSLKSLLTLS